MADKHSTSEQPASGRPIRVLVVDDHPVVRDGLRAMLDAPGIAVVGEASSGAIAVQRVDELQPDVILMDVRMPDMDGLTATRLIKERHANVSVFIVTSFSSVDYLQRAISSGASGYLLKGMSRDTLINSVRLVRDGGSVFDATLLQEVLAGIGYDPAASAAVRQLSDREREVIRLLAAGRTNREIGDLLGYSVGTIKNTVQAIMEKLEVSDRTQAAVLAVRAGILSTDPGGSGAA
ncbi:MAG: response regulator transcription factor [Dehalococcoidia bacterium]|nr:response regulator transcription factor [Dehalococcoidia bacterium]MCA9850131.1 response regulator transcription factor [Dehalococcoidia bacterium]MCA9856594.1 response regulator transcription factor [Dehalococcoidia bacterium]MCB9484426.1 response regulator transcription factor [Dehalococcoidia bacterium]MCB9490808.1 response regulator transcription factor [Dehalococcoidia bacterium]